jgi:hypothetical protein
MEGDRETGQLTVFGERHRCLVPDEGVDLICIDHRGQLGYICGCKSNIIPAAAGSLGPARILHISSVQVVGAVVVKPFVVDMDVELPELGILEVGEV